MDEIYVSVDIEASGPVPGVYSMLALGACRVDMPTRAFYAEIQPISDQFVPEAMEVTGFSLDQLRSTGREPGDAMRAFQDWVVEVAGASRPVFVGFNASFDWSFVNWYYYVYVGENPFGIGGIDIKSYYMGLVGTTWSETRSSHLPPEFQPRKRKTHNALDDARAQAEIFARLLTVDRRRGKGEGCNT